MTILKSGCMVLAVLFQIGSPSSFLVPGFRRAVSVSPNRIDQYPFVVRAGKTIQLRLEQGGADLLAEVIEPQGSIESFDVSESGPESIVVNATSNGVHWLRVSVVGGLAHSRTYGLILLGEHPTQRPDETRAQALLLATRGKLLASENKGEARRDALRLLAESAALFEELDDRRQLARVWSQHGSTLFALGQLDGARNSLERALSLSQAEGLSWTQGESLNNLGMVYWQLGLIDESRKCLQDALQIWERLDHLYGKAVCFNNLGILHRETGEYADALQAYQRVLEIVQSLGDANGEAYVNSNLGRVFQELAEAPQAIERFRRAAELFHLLGQTTAEGRTLLRLARVYLSGDERPDAESCVRQALPLVEAGGDARSQGEALEILGQLADFDGDLRSSLDHYRDAAALFESKGNRSGQSSALHHMGEVLFRMGDLQAASQHLERARVLRSLIGIPAEEAETLYQLAVVERSLGNSDRALSYARSAVSQIEQLRALVFGPRLRISYLASKQTYCKFLIDLLQLTGRSREALETSERRRARSLLDLAADRSNVSGSGLTERQLRIRRELSYWSTRLQALRQGPADPALEKELQTRLEGLLADYDLSDLKGESTTAPDPRASQPLPVLRELQEHLLDADTVLLEYSLGNVRSLMWAVDRESIEAYQLPGQPTLSEWMRDLRNALSEGGSEQSIADAARKLTRALLNPADGLLAGKRRIVIAPDGILHAMPFALLPEPGSDRPLLERFEVTTVPSISVLRELRGVSAQRRSPEGILAVFADPVFDKGDARVGDPAESDDGVRYPRLLYSRREAESALRLVPPELSLKAFDFEANRGRALSEFGGYRYLHLSTHSVVDQQLPELSALVFSQVDADGQERDGLLHAYEIASLHLNAELVVLSACQSGAGKLVEGEGMLGLAHSFLAAGASRVLVSLWKVDDEATSVLMKRFYEAALGPEHLSFSAALRNAQLTLWNSGRWHHPLYWSGWTLRGDWR